MVRSIFVVGALLSAGNSTCLAQGPIVIAGHVYDCTSRRPAAGALVTLRSPTSSGEPASATIRRSDAHGDFTIIGVAAGRYLLSAVAARVAPAIPGQTEAQRALRVDDGDVLAAPIGVVALPQPGQSRAAVPADAVARPLCDPAVIPPAPRSEDLYIIH